MKTIREQANEIMKEDTSHDVKREKLLKIGLTATDIQNLFFAERMAGREGRAARPVVEYTIDQILARYTFGVEIECYHVRVNELINKATERGLEMHSEGYNHRDNDTYYKLVSDGSIRGENPIECVSPILNGARGGFDTLKACCASLHECGAMVNRSTGLHIHVGGRITEKQYGNTFANYYYLESVIDSFMSPSRRENYYAKKLVGNVDAIVRARTFRQVGEAMNHDRYYKINCEAWGRHHTIEFRHHQGTTDYDKISYWTRFCIKLVHWSADHRLNAPVRSIDDVPFLTDDEKSFFKDRANAFAGMAMVDQLMTM